MHDELVEHAARVLRRAQDGALDAAALYDRVSRETGILCGVRLLLDRMAAHPGRFAILPPHHTLTDTHVWDTSDRTAYALALTVAGPAAWPIVTLCEEDEQPAASRAAPGLAEVHRSVAALLRSPLRDAALLGDVSSAVSALAAAGLTRPGPANGRSAKGRRTRCRP